MTNLKKSTATAALIAVMSAAPAMAFTEESGSPQQSVENDPDETVSDKPVTGESMQDTVKSDQGEGAYDDADVAEDVDGSLIKTGPRDDG